MEGNEEGVASHGQNRAKVEERKNTNKRRSIGFFGLQCTLPVKQKSFARKEQRFCAMQSKASEGKPTAQ